MNDATKGGILLTGILAIGISLGLGIGWKLWSPERGPKVETPALAVVQADGSQILERKPDAAAKPAQHLPTGAKLERVVQVTVQPHLPVVDPVSPLPSGSGVSGGGDQFTREDNLVPARPPCPPVRVDLSLVRMPDETRRVIASSPDGQVVGGVDIPLEASAPQRTLKWAAGAEYAVNSWGNTKSLVVHRDMGFLRVGGRLGRTVLTMPAGGPLGGGEAAISVLIRF